MRMPWPFRRNPQASSPNEAGMAPVAQREQRADWRNLPPLSETMAPPPLVAPNSRFSAGLAVNNAPPPSLGHMGHQRSLDATPGLALGLAKPVSRSVDAAAASAPVRASGSGLRRFLQRRTAVAAPAGAELARRSRPRSAGCARRSTVQSSRSVRRLSPRSAPPRPAGRARPPIYHCRRRWTSPDQPADDHGTDGDRQRRRRCPSREGSARCPRTKRSRRPRILTTAPRELSAPTAQRSRRGEFAEPNADFRIP